MTRRFRGDHSREGDYPGAPLAPMGSRGRREPVSACPWPTLFRTPSGCFGGGGGIGGAGPQCRVPALGNHPPGKRVGVLGKYYWEQ